jgi:Protein of unknown function (DUF3489)
LTGHRQPFAALGLAQNPLAFVGDRSDPCRDRGVTAKGENIMISNAEATETAPAPAAEAPKATKPARAGARRAPVAPKKAKSGKKATAAKKTPKGAKAAKGPKATAGARDGSKTAKVLEMLKRPGGVTGKELMKATGWQPHSVRGFLSGTIGKKMGLTVTSTTGEDGERTYAIKA